MKTGTRQDETAKRKTSLHGEQRWILDQIFEYNKVAKFDLTTLDSG